MEDLLLCVALLTGIALVISRFEFDAVPHSWIP